MSWSRRSRRAMAAAALTWVVLAATACTEDNADSGSSPPPTATTSSATTSSVPVANQPFGDCPNLPDSGDGSLIDLSNRDWIDALSHLPALSQLAVTTALAGLGRDFNGIDQVTVFAPTDEAFRRLGAARGRELLTDPARGAEVLRYHVVAGRIAPEQLPGTHLTLMGQTLSVTGSGDDFTVNGQATILCGNLQTKNATLYLIDRVLQPS